MDAPLLALTPQTTRTAGRSTQQVVVRSEEHTSELQSH